ncbi:Lipoprotein-releasing system ATP-binding protein LolD [Sedimentisphaera cyanobacteriorum]|uniref:Lipoprotein-releasing system ATP-binding protein LolD n=1 Tax=Sedimentisphaera cyanobacteriorum TaxID=1940790 RepID=A0A1Q2HMU8_9BACT|nr:ABC transporter ATP-binding protein [Sedimentisphaera cyanobacteriorum]AQQ08584.1 Lipoprotein-releasing system ATP-binding protein LolD [Sedimentisphaera cyanobacteriorum]
MKAIISCEKLCKSYPLGQSRIDVLKGADLSVQDGEFVVIVGASGSGKSTLLHILGALDKPDSGKVFFSEEQISRYSGRKLDSYRNQNIGFVFQFYHLIEELNVMENILIPAMAGCSAIRWAAKSSSAKNRGRQLAERLGLSERLKHRPSQLSGGERQRAAIGRALINNPRVLLADEPTGNLDWHTGTEILDILKDFHKNGQTILLVTHDERIASMADRVVAIQDGAIV